MLLLLKTEVHVRTVKEAIALWAGGTSASHDMKWYILWQLLNLGCDSEVFNVIWSTPAALDLCLYTYSDFFLSRNVQLKA